MAFSGIVASTVAAFCIFSVVNGQFNPPTEIPGCNSRNLSSGNYLAPHPGYCMLYMHCDTGLNQNTRECPDGLLFDNSINNCNWPEQTMCPFWPCDTNRINTRYPDICCDRYYVCNGFGFSRRTCPAGQSFNSQTGQCTAGACNSHALCKRLGTTNPDPRINCNLQAEPNNVCAFRIVGNGTVSELVNCPEGTAYNPNACACTDSLVCARSATVNGSISKRSDPECRASLRIEFTNTGIRTFSDKLAQTPTPTNTYVESRGVQFANSLATFTSNPQTGAQPYLYIPAFSNNQLSMNTAISCIFRAARNHAFQLISNDFENNCSPTLEANATFTGNSYQVTVTITGMTQSTVNTQVTNRATLTASINAAPTDFIEIIIIYNRAGQFQLVNRGNAGTANQQVVSSPVSGILGDFLAYNRCGYRFGDSFNGDFIRVTFREGCADITRARV